MNKEKRIKNNGGGSPRQARLKILGGMCTKSNGQIRKQPTTYLK